MKKFQMKPLLFVLLLLGPIRSIAQDISRADAVEDLQFLLVNIERYNPALAGYHPEFNELANQVIEGVDGDSYSIFSFFTQVSQVCALANEGHFALGTWEDAVHKGILDDSFPFLPIRVKYCAGNLHVWRDYSGSQQFEPRDKILSINGMTTEAIMDALVAVTPSDGFIQSYAYRQIEATFPFSYFFYIDQSETFDIGYAGEDGVEKRASVQALTWSEQAANLKKYQPEEPESSSGEPDGFYDLVYEDDRAQLTLPSFDFRRVQKFEVKSEKMYKTIFSELQARQVKHLIVDLRDNTGGRNEFADDMVPFILKPSRESSYLKKTYSWEGKERVYKMPKASKLAFQGSIYVLVNGKTFSAGSSLARYLKEYGGAIVIGTETGTRYEGFAGGSTETITLPNSQIEIGIPRYLIAYPPSQLQNTRNQGLLPDHSIRYSFEDMAEGRDLHLEKARSLIGQLGGQ